MAANSFVDPESGWQVEEEITFDDELGEEVYQRTLTNPNTGDTIESVGLVSAMTNISAAVSALVDWKSDWEQEERESRERIEAIWPELVSGADVPDGALGRIKIRFAEYFHGQFTLPDDAVEERRRGTIENPPWTVWYLFDQDHLGEFLDFYACNRFTNARHVRIRETGEQEGLPAEEDMYISSKDPDKAARLEAEYFAKNREIGEMLKLKGFGPWSEMQDL